MRPALLLVTLTLVAGCAAPTPEEIQVASAPASGPVAPQVFEWSGHVVASEIEGPTHQRPTEDAMWPVMQEGILFHVAEAPQAMEVSLGWTGPGAFMIMLHSHKADGTNAYVEHVTELDDVNPKCLRVPPEDLADGHWQVMVHSEGARLTDFTLRVALMGGSGAIVEDDRHGHWPQDGAFDIDEHDVLACEA